MRYERFTRASVKEFATLIVKALPAEHVAALLDGMLSMESNPEFTDRECQFGVPLFDELCDQCPEAVEIAQGKATATR